MIRLRNNVTPTSCVSGLWIAGRREADSPVGATARGRTRECRLTASDWFDRTVIGKCRLRTPATDHVASSSRLSAWPKILSDRRARRRPLRGSALSLLAPGHGLPGGGDPDDVARAARSVGPDLDLVRHEAGFAQAARESGVGCRRPDRQHAAFAQCGVRRLQVRPHRRDASFSWRLSPSGPLSTSSRIAS